MARATGMAAAVAMPPLISPAAVVSHSRIPSALATLAPQPTHRSRPCRLLVSAPPAHSGSDGAPPSTLSSSAASPSGSGNKGAGAPTFQQAIQRLQEYWASVGCAVMQCSNTEVGAGTMNPLTFLRVLGPEPWNVAKEKRRRPGLQETVAMPEARHNNGHAAVNMGLGRWA